MLILGGIFGSECRISRIFYGLGNECVEHLCVWVAPCKSHDIDDAGSTFTSKAARIANVGHCTTSYPYTRHHGRTHFFQCRL